MRYYFFNSNYNFYFENNNELIGVWDDEKSTLLGNLLNKLKYNFFIEESLYNHYSQFIELKPFKIVTSKNIQENNYKPNDLFFLSSDTIARMFKNILEHENYINKNNILISTLKRENEIVEIIKMGKPYMVLENKPELKGYDRIILGNDWGPIEKRIIDIFDGKGKLSFCLQESVIDFSSGSQRMKYCDIPMIQGINTLSSLKRPFFALTGNPRYEDLSVSHRDENAPVIINSNFTYGISESYKDLWLGDIISSLEQMKIDYKIARHPRDKAMGKYSNNIIESNASVIHDILSSGSLLITRFSSLIHEALILGRPVIYYNLMNEEFNYDFGFNNEFIFQAKNKSELMKALWSIFKDKKFSEDNIKSSGYLNNHVGQDVVKPSRKIVNFLSGIHLNSINTIKNVKPITHKIKNILVYYKLRYK